MHVFVCMCVYICICMYVCVYACICMHVCVCVYVLKCCLCYKRCNFRHNRTKELISHYRGDENFEKKNICFRILYLIVVYNTKKFHSPAVSQNYSLHIYVQLSTDNISKNFNTDYLQCRTSRYMNE